MDERYPSPARPEGDASAPLRRSRLGLVPADYAEKTMSSLLSLHQDLMAEKERTLDVTRRLMAAEQARAELEAYVEILEAELARRGGPNLGPVRAAPGASPARAAAALLRQIDLAPLGATRAPTPQRPPSDRPEPAPAPARAERSLPRDSSERVLSRPAPASPPDPPRPSRTYRPPVAAREVGVGAPSPEPPPPAPAGPTHRPEPQGSSGPEGPGEDWRQW